jgi:hypothetical protein
MQGLQLIDKYHNWYNINKLFTMTNNSTFLCSDKIIIVLDNLIHNNAQNITEQINTATKSTVGSVGALATLGRYYQSFEDS